MNDMKVTKLINIGPGLERLLAELDIHTAEEFLAQDPEELYTRLEKNHPNLHLAVLASFIGAQTKTPWYFIYHGVKKRFRSE
jgi:DNA transformation protein